MIGLTTILMTGSDLRATLGSLLALWLGSTTVFVLFGGYAVHRLVVGPVQRLTAEADALAVGEFPAHMPQETAELELLAARYRAMAENLLDVQSQVVRVEKLAGIGRLAAGVAHEVRNPLGALASYVEVLQRRGADPKVTGTCTRPSSGSNGSCKVSWIMPGPASIPCRRGGTTPALI